MRKSENFTSPTTDQLGQGAESIPVVHGLLGQSTLRSRRAYIPSTAKLICGVLLASTRTTARTPCCGRFKVIPGLGVRVCASNCGPVGTAPGCGHAGLEVHAGGLHARRSVWGLASKFSRLSVGVWVQKVQVGKQEEEPSTTSLICHFAAIDSMPVPRSRPVRLWTPRLREYQDDARVFEAELFQIAFQECLAGRASRARRDDGLFLLGRLQNTLDEENMQVQLDQWLTFTLGAAIVESISDEAMRDCQLLFLRVLFIRYLHHGSFEGDKVAYKLLEEAQMSNYQQYLYIYDDPTPADFSWTEELDLRETRHDDGVQDDRDSEWEDASEEAEAEGEEGGEGGGRVDRLDG
ncbi:hypothetical protein B0H14DRAFT_3160242 [Mycena olivaceomarginata]|nr:hypothetical protein B0H14DRAFT_3160242 [Mycena olivaceomarginata]